MVMLRARSGAAARRARGRLMVIADGRRMVTCDAADGRWMVTRFTPLQVRYMQIAAQPRTERAVGGWRSAANSARRRALARRSGREWGSEW